MLDCTKMLKSLNGNDGYKYFGDIIRANVDILVNDAGMNENDAIIQVLSDLVDELRGVK